MNVEIVMTRESFDCLEKLIPREVSEGMPAPVFMQASGTTPHQVVLTCSLAKSCSISPDTPVVRQLRTSGSRSRNIRSP